jgi:Anaphase-promoting complex APC subunit CDC26
MLRRKPTRVELTQADMDELDLVRREAEVARISADTVDAAAPPTRRETAVAGMSARERLGVTEATAATDAANAGVRPSGHE